mgnify:CR=1 FL=1|tara:strand:+ start:312 stop:1121 length:810 start_codon:yes stop_codon:yes gene_type:complete
MKKYLVLVFSILINCSFSSAQFFDKEHLNDLSIGLNFGLTQFYGDVSVEKNIKPAFSLQVNKLLESDHYIQAEFLMGRLSGQNAFTGSCENEYHTLNNAQVQHETAGERFDAEFMEFDLNYLVNLATLYNQLLNYLETTDIKETIPKQGDRRSRLTALAKVGVGINIFRSVRRELETNKFMNSYGYQWLWQNNFQEAGIYHVDWDKNIKESTIVIGLLTKYQISNKFEIDLSITNRIGRHDKWDSKISDKSDVFTFYSLGATYNFNNNE